MKKKEVKRGQKNSKDMKQKTKSKIANVNSDISILTLSMKGLNILIKS